MVVRCLKQVGKVTRLNKWADRKKKKKKKIVILNCCLLLFYSTTNHFSIRLWHAMKTGFYMITSSVAGPRKKLQSTSQSQTCTKKKVLVTVWWSAACLIHYNFLNPSETVISEKYTQQIDEMHRELQCLKPALVNRTGPVLLHNAGPHVA